MATIGLALPFILGGIAVVGGIAYFVGKEEESGLPSPYPIPPPAPPAGKDDADELFGAFGDKLPENVWISVGGVDWGADPDIGTPPGASVARFYVTGGGGVSALEEAIEVYEQVVLPAAITHTDMGFQIIGPGSLGGEEGAVYAFTMDWKDPRSISGTGPHYASYNKLVYGIKQSELAEARATLTIWPDPVVIEFGKALQNGITEKMKFDAFPLSSNKILVSSQCTAVVEGDMFWPRWPIAGMGTPGPNNPWPQVSVNAVEAPSLSQVLAVPNNSAIGYVDYVIANDPNASVLGITNDIIDQAAQMSGTLCPSVNYMSEGMVEYFNWLKWRVQHEADMSDPGIPFAPPNP